MSDNSPSLGKLIDALDRIRELRREVRKKDDELKAKYNTIEQQVLAQLEEQDSSGSRGRTAQASIKTSIVPTVTDWAALNRYILRHKMTELYQKRLSPVVYRELLEDNPRGIPGTEPFEKVSLHVSKIKR